MIQTHSELEIARDQLKRVESALESLKNDVLEVNPKRFELMSEGYIEEIRCLRAQVDHYLLGQGRIIKDSSEFEIRLEGKKICLGSTRSSLITSILDNFRRGILSLFVTASENADLLASASGRRKRWMEVLSDPPVIALEPGSVRIHLGVPESSDLFHEQDIDLFKQTVVLLSEGIAWASRDDADLSELNLNAMTQDRLKHVLLNSVKNLAPSRNSDVEVVSFSGNLIDGQGVLQLTKDARPRITNALKQLSHVTQPADIEGVIREIDLDKNTFTLRERDDDGADLVCNYHDAIEPDIIECLDSHVIVSGSLQTNKKNGHQTLDVEFVELLDSGEESSEG
ncbi:MAG: hypothetical protein R3C45_12055 [Phycisphaerales bacterium]